MNPNAEKSAKNRTQIPFDGNTVDYRLQYYSFF